MNSPSAHPRFDRGGKLDSGRVWILFGDVTLDPTDDHLAIPAAKAMRLTFDGTEEGAWFGASLATAQDENGKYLTDLLVGAPGNGPVDGPNAIPGSVYQIDSSSMEQGGLVGSLVLGMNIKASPLKAAPGISGSVDSGYILTANRVLRGDQPGDRFGCALAFVGDLDGLPGQEFLVGAPQYTAEIAESATTGPGYVRLFRLSNPTPLVTIPGTLDPGGARQFRGEAFGFAVAGGIQLDPHVDSTPDLIVGAPRFDVTLGVTTMPNAGRVVAYSGQAAANGSIVPLLVDSPTVNGTVMVGSRATDGFGFSVTGVVGLDAFPLTDEILVGAWDALIIDGCHGASTAPLRQAGAAYVYSPGSADPGTPIYKFFGEASRDHMGRAVGAGHLVTTSPSTTPERPEIVLSGVALSTPGVAEAGRGYLWVGEFLP